MGVVGVPNLGIVAGSVYGPLVPGHTVDIWADLTLAECAHIGLEYVGPREKPCLYRSMTDVSGIRMNMTSDGVWLFEWFYRYK